MINIMKNRGHSFENRSADEEVFRTNQSIKNMKKVSHEVFCAKLNPYPFKIKYLDEKELVRALSHFLLVRGTNDFILNK